MHKARYWKKVDDKQIVCLLCPRTCRIGEGERGHCYVRENIDSQMILNTYGRSSGFALDPIEKKPLYHFYPGSTVYSFGTEGCNLACQFCQNWHITRAKDDALLSHLASPMEIAQSAQTFNARSVAFTYNDPVIFLEYAVDTAKECHSRDIKTIAVTAGYINPKPATEFFSHMDAANVDLKSFSDEFYKKYTDSSIKPVLKILEYLATKTSVWLEITTLLIPGYNDSDVEVKELSRWIHDHLGDQVPLHFSSFHPDFLFSHVNPTPLQTLIHAREIALDTGLKYVYTGNIRNRKTESTYCPSCKNLVIERDGFSVLQMNMNPDQTCKQCRHKIAGHF